MAHRLLLLDIIGNLLDLNLLIQPLFILYDILVNFLALEHRLVLRVLPQSWLLIDVRHMLIVNLRIDVLLRWRFFINWQIIFEHIRRFEQLQLHQ